MGNCFSQDDSSEAQASAEIDRALEQDRERLSRECRILLLGSGESGKSTIVKQMKIIHKNGYSEDELRAFRIPVYKNIVDSAIDLVLGMTLLQIAPEIPENRQFAEFIDQYISDDANNNGGSLNDEFVAKMHALWQDPCIPKLLNRAYAFYLMDSAGYFFENIQRIGEPDYIPTVEDVLRVRSRTTGILETKFTMGVLNVHLVDVGGQNSERNKWIRAFESVTSIIFCVAISEYDQPLLEDASRNRMHDSLYLFDIIIRSRWLMAASVILFLNKIDIFKRKIMISPLTACFPEYNGGASVENGVDFISHQFVTICERNNNRQVYSHITEATNTSSIALVFAAVKETLLQNALRDSGIL
ncbi:G protein alpha subunit [Ramicandelaber brevisporus]|nr:G protein alpha subunit [Ramicandelaber brevisporus]